jgi:hypothetical protein
MLMPTTRTSTKEGITRAASRAVTAVNIKMNTIMISTMTKERLLLVSITKVMAKVNPEDVVIRRKTQRLSATSP